MSEVSSMSSCFPFFIYYFKLKRTKRHYYKKTKNKKTKNKKQNKTKYFDSKNLFCFWLNDSNISTKWKSILFVYRKHKYLSPLIT